MSSPGASLPLLGSEKRAKTRQFSGSKDECAGFVASLQQGAITRFLSYRGRPHPFIDFHVEIVILHFGAVRPQRVKECVGELGVPTRAGIGNRF